MAGLLEDFRAKYPQYNNRTDDELESALYEKFYSNNMTRAEFYNKLQAKSVGQQMTGTQPVAGEVVQRSHVLPLGKTAEGNVVPAMPQWAADAITAIRHGIDTGDLSPKDATSIAALVAPDAKGALEGIGEGVSALRGLKKPPIPTTAETKAASQAAYKSVERAGGKMAPESFRSMVSEIIPEIKKAGFDKDIQPAAAAALRRLQTEIELGNAPTLPELDILRQVAGGAAKSNDANERRMARIITGKMDEFLDNAKPGDFTGPVDVATLKQARSLWARQAKSDQIDEMFEKALNRAPGTPALGFEGQLRNQFKALADNKNRLRRFSADEQEAIKTVARGEGNIQKALVQIGKFSPNAGFFAAVVSGSIGIESLHDPRLLALPIAGGIARWAATKIREGQANRARDIVRGGKEAADFFKNRRGLRKQLESDTFSAATRPGLAIGGSFLQDSDYSTP